MNSLVMRVFVLGLALAAVSACGGEGTVPFKQAGPPPPRSCLKRYNADPAALYLGRHAYSPGHSSRAARVFAFDKPKFGLENQCAVIYADRESDREYGTLGQYSSGVGWQLMTTFPVKSQQDRIALQRSGAEQANAKLNPDGTLSAF